MPKNTVTPEQSSFYYLMKTSYLLDGSCFSRCEWFLVKGCVICANAIDAQILVVVYT